MRTIRLLLVYDGTDYHGWQRQPGRRTVQGTLEAALEKVTGAPHRIVGSSRTDAGVHALGQVAAFRTASRLPADTLRRALNANLPHDVVAVEAAEAAPSFHPLADAAAKRYRYLLGDGPFPDVFRRRYIWQRWRDLDAEAMHRAGQALVGRHDFASFQSAGSPREDTVRTLFDVAVTRGFQNEAHLLAVEVEGDGFLYNMVRTIVGTLVEVGRGARGAPWVADVLAARDRGRAGPTAPPEGLYLLWVRFAGGAAQGTWPSQGLFLSRPKR